MPATGFGTVQTGTVPPAQSTLLTFNAPAGLPIALDYQLGDFSPVTLTLTAPDGSRVFATSNDQGPFILPVSGTYTLKLQNFNASTAQPYAFRLIDLTTVPTLALGTTVQGTLDPNYARDLYRFDGGLGQRLVFDALTPQPLGFSYQLFTPDGRTINLYPQGNTLPAPPLTLTAAGTYYLSASASSPQSSTVAYSFELLDLAAAAPALALGQPVAGHLNPGTAVQVYTINGTAGQTLEFHSLSLAPSDEGTATWTLYGPDNTPLGGVFSGTHDLSEDFSAVLPADGVSLLVITGTSSAAPVDYNIEVVDPSVASATSPGITLLTGQNGSVRYAYDPVFHQVTNAIDALGRETRYTIDPTTGNTLVKTEVNPAGSGDLVTHYTYTAHGLLASVVDPLGRKTTYTYDDLDRLTAVTEAAGTALAATAHTEYDAAGNITAIIDANSQRTEYAHDTAGRVIKVTSADGSTIDYGYDADGNVTSVTDPLGHASTTVYDTPEPSGERDRPGGQRHDLRLRRRRQPIERDRPLASRDAD